MHVCMHVCVCVCVRARAGARVAQETHIQQWNVQNLAAGETLALKRMLWGADCEEGLQSLRIQESQCYHGLSIICCIHKAFTVWPPPASFPALPFSQTAVRLQNSSHITSYSYLNQEIEKGLCWVRD